MDNTAHHVETQIGDWKFSLERATSSAPTTTNTTFYVYVENIDAAYHRALALGAIPLTAPENKPNRERSAEVQDTDGNRWKLYSFTQPARVQRH